MGVFLIVIGVSMMVIGAVFSVCLDKYDKLVRCVALCTGAVVVMCGLACQAVEADASKLSSTDYVVRFVLFMLIAVIAGMRARHHYINRDHDMADEKVTIHRTIPSRQIRMSVLDDDDFDALTERERQLFKEIEANLIDK